ncbi:sacsin N-terminal ATP-binding-like domain-containing protein [Actinophytocola sp.]|uniref:sacsin N-terminal ATP-binding-like domain-containing protein n=1 Tax=Actinophytocola sp. TaxID=1872138 RepID=UPI003D6A4B68
MSDGLRVSDPFRTEALRESVLASWRDSPTRFREDANAEEDLFLGGYRDRLLVELAQNAADAAAHTAEAGGRLRVSFVDREVRVANAGRPLDAAGVASLASLRASAKQHGVGRFGVGFAAVLAVSDAPRVVSRTGSVTFSAERTREVTGRSGRVPVLRLVWPTDERPPDGFDTEVRLPLRDGVDPAELRDEFARQVTDLLLSLDSLGTIEIEGDTWRRDDDGPRTDIHGPGGTSRWLVVREHGELADLTGLGTEARPQWTVCWAARLDAPLGDDVLHAPTRTDERLSLPARLIAALPIEADRRRVRPGPATDAVLDHAARTYPRLLELREPHDRTRLVPRAGFPLSEVDERLRARIAEALRTTAWLPTRTGAVEPRHARTVPAPELVDALDDTVDGLTTAEHDAALQALDVTRLTIADIVDRVTGIDRPPAWWHRLYAALAPIADVDRDAREALGALPVPLTDGRTRPGPRGLLIAEDTDLELDLAIVHPDAVHPLLERLGARRASAADLLDSTREAVERSLEDAESGMDVTALRHTVLTLVGETGARPGERPWLAALALPDDAGDHRRADELALPGAALLDVLDPDAPIGVLRDDVAARWRKHVLTAIGVLDTFAVVVDEQPAGPDHDLADEHDWWDGLPEPPASMTAVRDLDLVADDAWPAALRLLAAEPRTWQALHEPRGYTGWWIAHHALIAGRPPRAWRLPDATELAGLYDPVPPIDVADSVLTAVGVRATLRVGDDAGELLERLADPDSDVPAGAALRAHAALAAAVRDGVIEPADLHAPHAVRSLTGQVVPAAEGLVLDAPWLLGVVEPERVIGAGPDPALAEPLAELLDLPLAAEVVTGTVTGSAEPVRWADLGAVVDACDLAGIAVPPGGPYVHDRLTVRIGLSEHDVSWWVDEGVPHCVDSTPGLARALAWAGDRWADRHLLAALLDDPESVLG